MEQREPASAAEFRLTQQQRDDRHPRSPNPLLSDPRDLRPATHLSHPPPPPPARPPRLFQQSNTLNPPSFLHAPASPLRPPCSPYPLPPSLQPRPLHPPTPPKNETASALSTVLRHSHHHHRQVRDRECFFFCENCSLLLFFLALLLVKLILIHTTSIDPQRMLSFPMNMKNFFFCHLFFLYHICTVWVFLHKQVNPAH